MNLSTLLNTKEGSIEATSQVPTQVYIAEKKSFNLPAGVEITARPFHAKTKQKKRMTHEFRSAGRAY